MGKRWLSSPYLSRPSWPFDPKRSMEEPESFSFDLPVSYIQNENERESPSLLLLKNDFKKFFVMEKCMYASNGNISNFFTKWGVLSALCQEQCFCLFLGCFFLKFTFYNLLYVISLWFNWSINEYPPGIIKKNNNKYCSFFLYLLWAFLWRLFCTLRCECG